MQPSHKHDLPVTHSSPLCTWLSVLSFFSSSLKPRCQDRVMGFVGGGSNIAILTAIPQLISVLIVFKYLLVYGIHSSHFLCLPGTSVSGCGD